MKPSDDPSLGRSDNVCDIVRCMLVYENIADLRAGLRAIVSDKMTRVLRVKDRFGAPTSGGMGHNYMGHN